jgi:Holliday junction resolvase
MPVNAKGSRRERELLEKLNDDGFIAHRIAGSGTNVSAVCDLIAVKEGMPFFVEVKSRKKVYYPGGDLAQLELLREMAKQAGAKPLLAVKLNYRPWQILDISRDIPKKVF